MLNFNFFPILTRFMISLETIVTIETRSMRKKVHKFGIQTIRLAWGKEILCQT